MPTRNAVRVSATENLFSPPAEKIGRLKSKGALGPTFERDVAMTAAKLEVLTVIHQANLKIV